MKYYRENSHSWVEAQDFEETSSGQLLAFSATEVSGKEWAGKKPAWVFDLDSTLFCTGPRNQRVFWKFLQAKDSFPQHWASIWRDMGSAIQQYSIPKTFYSILRNYGWSEEDAKSEAKTIWEDYQDHWMKEFFLSSNISHDPAYPGALEFVEKVRAQGCDIVYLTGRDSPRAMEGTLHALRAAGFPMGEGCHIRLKPFSSQGDLEFKLKASQRLNSEFEVLGLIENEPENLVMFAELFPKSMIVFFHSIMSARIPKKEIKNYLGERPLYRMKNF